MKTAKEIELLGSRFGAIETALHDAEVDLLCAIAENQDPENSEHLMLLLKNIREARAIAKRLDPKR